MIGKAPGTAAADALCATCVGLFDMDGAAMSMVRRRGRSARAARAPAAISSAGLLLADGRGVLYLMASSSEVTHLLEVFQLQRDEGPCLDCYREGRAVQVPDSDADEERWPHFREASRVAGFRSVHALPMRLKGNVLCTLGLFGQEVGALGRRGPGSGAGAGPRGLRGDHQ